MLSELLTTPYTDLQIGMSTSRLSSYFKALSTTYHEKETKNKWWKLCINIVDVDKSQKN